MTIELRNIILKNNLKTVFQPIVSLETGDVIGYEALTRGPKDSKYINPELLFDDAKKYNLLWNLEILCRSNAIKTYSSYNKDKLLFVNVDPGVLKDTNFIKGFTKEILVEYNISPMSLIFEITEKSSIENYKNFKEVIDYYKHQGYRMAIDDVGTGFSGLTTIAETRPLYIKIDMGLIAGVYQDNFKKAIIKALVEFANTTNTKIIAEGIENINDLYTLIEMGVHYGQGYLISRPVENLAETPDELKKSIVDKNISIQKQRFNPCSNVMIGEIARLDKQVLPSVTCSEIDKIFKSNPNLKGLPIADNDSVIVGIIMYSDFLSKVGTQYGWSLYMKRPVHLVMDSHPLIVDYNIPLDKVSKIVISREEDKLYDYIIVEKNNKYYGIVPVISLLEKTMELELNVAKYANPLTGLPGNVVIEDSISKILSDETEFSLMYFDLNDFKAYNDTYGFEKGDKIISYTAAIIQKNVSKHKDGFLGHIGGDDFVAIVQNQDVKKLCEDILLEFDNNIHHFYNEEDRRKGYILSINRNNHEEIFPLMSLSIAVITNQNRTFSNIYEISEAAAMLKKKCKIESKKIMKSCFFISVDSAC